jgi:hypothetical protein
MLLVLLRLSRSTPTRVSVKFLRALELISNNMTLDADTDSTRSIIEDHGFERIQRRVSVELALGPTTYVITTPKKANPKTITRSNLGTLIAGPRR